MLAVLAALIRDLVFGTPGNGDVPTWNTTNSRAEWQSIASPNLAAVLAAGNGAGGIIINMNDGSGAGGDSLNMDGGGLVNVTSIAPPLGDVPLNITGTVNHNGSSINLNAGAGTGGGNISMDGGEIKGLRVDNNLGSPSLPNLGQIYFETGDNHFYGYNGSTWVQLDN